MDRQIAGVLGVALVCGTVLTMVAAPRRPPVLITGIHYPSSMIRSSGDFSFTISFVATRKVDNVEIHIRTLRGYLPSSLDLGGLGPKDIEEKFQTLEAVRDFSSDLGFPAEPKEFELKSANKSEYDLDYYDFSPVLELLSKEHQDRSITLVTSSYAFMYRGDRLSLCFKGGSEIFPNEDSTLSDIAVEIDGEPIKTWERGEDMDYDMGRITIGAVQQGSEVDLIYHVDGRRIAGGGFLGLIDIKVEGRPLRSLGYLINV